MAIFFFFLQWQPEVDPDLLAKAISVSFHYTLEKFGLKSADDLYHFDLEWNYGLEGDIWEKARHTQNGFMGVPVVALPKVASSKMPRDLYKGLRLLSRHKNMSMYCGGNFLVSGWIIALRGAGERVEMLLLLEQNELDTNCNRIIAPCEASALVLIQVDLNSMQPSRLEIIFKMANAFLQTYEPSMEQ